MDKRGILKIAPFVYAIAIVLTTFIGSGKAVGAVAAVGGIALGAMYALLREPSGSRADRE